MNKKINIELDYPLGEKRKEWLKTPTGKTLDDITLENVLDEKIKAQDIRISSETLNLQGEVAETAGQPTIKRNFQRASELVKISDERILEIYNALRPNRSSKDELLAILIPRNTFFPYRRLSLARRIRQTNFPFSFPVWAQTSNRRAQHPRRFYLPVSAL